MSDESKPKKHALNNPKIILTAPCPTAPGKISQLKWDIYLNNPRIVVRTNDPSLMDKANSFGTIQAGMDTPIFYAWLELLKFAIDANGEVKNRIQNNGYENEHLSDIWVGKDKEGCVFISVISRKDEKPVIKFVFGPSDGRYHSLFHADGTGYTKAELSVIYAKAYYRLLGDIMGPLLVDTYVEPPPYIPKGKGAYNKQGSGGYQNKGYQQQSGGGDISADDLPF